MSIQEHLNKIRNAVYGHEVRESIAKGIETAYDDASEKDNANMEVKIARGTHPNLRSRLEEVDNKQQQTTAQLQQTEQELSSQLAHKADKSQIGAPLTASGIAGMTDKTRVYVNTTDGKWYSWNGTAWVAGGIYNSQGIADGSITAKKISPEGLVPSVLNGVEVKSATPTINLFDKGKIRAGGYYGTDGVWISNANFASSDFTPVAVGTVYKAAKTATFVRWDENKNPLGGGNTQELSVPSGTYFVTFNMALADVDTMMFTKKAEYPAVYVPHKAYTYGFSPTIWDVPDPDADIEPENIVGVTKHIEKTVNLFDKTSIIPGGYYGTDGVWVVNASYVSTNFIPVIAGVTYTPTKSATFVRWDANKVRVGGGNTKDIVIPADTAFVTFNMLVGDVDTMMFTKKAEYPAVYAPHEIVQYRTDKRYVLNKWESVDPQNITQNASRISEIEDVYSPRHTPPKELHLPDWSGYNQPYHPSVVYIANGFAGYKYWMVQTPFPVGAQPYRDRWECPVVYKSNDAINWVIVANPLDDLTETEIANKDYMSDPHMVYRPDTNTLEVFYRLTEASVAGLPTVTFKKTTQDGINWSARQVVIPPQPSTDTSFVRSPSILWDNTNKLYRFWYTNNTGLYYNTLPDGGSWNGATQQKVTLDDGIVYWHTDVNYFKGEYHFLGYSNGDWFKNPEAVVHYTSTDGLNFKRNRELLSTADGHPLYSKGLYRSVSLLGAGDVIHVFFSGTNENNQTRVGLMSSDTFGNFQPAKKIQANMIRTKSGHSMEELYQEIIRIKKLLS